MGMVQQGQLTTCRDACCQLPVTVLRGGEGLSVSQKAGYECAPQF